MATYGYPSANFKKLTRDDMTGKQFATAGTMMVRRPPQAAAACALRPLAAPASPRLRPPVASTHPARARSPPPATAALRRAAVRPRAPARPPQVVKEDDEHTAYLTLESLKEIVENSLDGKVVGNITGNTDIVILGDLEREADWVRCVRAHMRERKPHLCSPPARRLRAGRRRQGQEHHQAAR